MRPKSHFHVLGDILDKLFPKAKWGEKQKQYAFFEQWGTIVGKAIAKQALPLRWSKNTLVVGVKDSCWLQELKMMEGEILEKIRQAKTELKIDGIRFTISENSESLPRR